MPRKLMLYHDIEQLLRHLPPSGTASTSIPRGPESRHTANQLANRIRRTAERLGIGVKVHIEDVPGFPITVIVQSTLPD